MSTTTGKRVARDKLTLTKRTVETPQPADKAWIAWDDRLIGFGVRVQPSGAKAFVVNYRTGSGGRKARNRRIAWWPPSPTRWTSSTSTGLTPFRAGSYGTRRASPFQVRVSARFGPPRRPSMPKVCVDGTSSWSVLEERFRSLSAPGFAARSRFRIPILTQPTRQNAPQQRHTKFPSHFERIDESPPIINTRATRMEAAALPHCQWVSKMSHFCGVIGCRRRGGLTGSGDVSLR